MILFELFCFRLKSIEDFVCNWTNQLDQLAKVRSAAIDREKSMIRFEFHKLAF